MTLGDSCHSQIVTADAVFAFAKRMKLFESLFVHGQDPHAAKELDRLLKRRKGAQSFLIILARRIWLYQPVSISSTVIIVTESFSASTAATCAHTSGWP
jgi:hypothetical protein